MSMNAQDIVVLNDGTEIQARIIAENDSTVEYKNWINIDGPSEIVSTTEIAALRYENGTVREFAAVYVASEEEKTAKRIPLRDKKGYFTLYLAPVGLNFSFGNSDCSTVSMGGTFSIQYDIFPSEFKQVFWSIGGGVSYDAFASFGPVDRYGNSEYEDFCNCYFYLLPQCGWDYGNSYVSTGPKLNFLLAGCDISNSFMFSWSFSAGYKTTHLNPNVKLGVTFDIGLSNVYSGYDKSAVYSILPTLGLYF